MNSLLQIFLYLDVFIIGAVFAVALRHGIAHYRPAELPAKQPKDKAEANHLSLAMRQKLIEQSSDKFKLIIDHSAKQLEQELAMTGERINITVKKLAADIVTKELEGFQTMFRQYQERAVKELEDTKTKTDLLTDQLQSQAQAAAIAEQQRLLDLIDNRLSDSVMSFLVEAMQHEVDLGSQSDYLIKLLETHKDEFKQAVQDEA